jgi:hypothetical protein
MSIFSKVAMPKPASNTFDLSHDRKFSMKLGEITPILVNECVPGDKFNISSTNLLRFAPLIAPVMHQSSVYIHFFFVPNRILWSNWEDFISGGEDGLADPAFPVIKPNATLATGSLLDYLGLPTGKATGTDTFNSLPVLAYNKIYNDYYRDQNMVPVKLTEDAINGEQTATDVTNPAMQKRAWQHDYFTSALPWTQKGPEATIPLGTQAPLVYGNFTRPGEPGDFLYAKAPASSGGAKIQGSSTATDPILTGTSPYAGVVSQTGFGDFNLDMSSTHVADLSDATASSINDLRRAFRLQEWLERNARGGSRYIEIIMAHFGVKSSDSRS